MSSGSELRYRQIFSFWSPLALTWAMMAIEGPVLNSVVSRLPDQRGNLAAFGLALGIAMIVESPIIMLLSATVALVRDHQSFEALLRYGNRLNVLVTLMMVFVVIPPVFDVIAFNALSLTPDVAAYLHKGLLCLLLWPAAIGYRRTYQGLMIRHGQTRQIAIGSIARITTMFVSSIAVAMWTELPGAVVGCVGLASGVLFESAATRWMAREAVAAFRGMPASDHGELSVHAIRRFYRPLVLTAFLTMALNPMLSFFMSRFQFMLESLATYPVIDSFVFQFRSPGFSYQEVGIALLDGTRQRLRKVRNFGIALMVITTTLLALVSFSPLLSLIYTVFPYHLTSDLAQFALDPTRVMVLLPAFSVLYSFQRAVLINQHHTKQVTWSTLVEVVAIFVILMAELLWANMSGVMAACVALILGRIVASFYLSYAYRQASRSTR